MGAAQTQGAGGIDCLRPVVEANTGGGGWRALRVLAGGWLWRVVSGYILGRPRPPESERAGGRNADPSCDEEPVVELGK